MRDITIALVHRGKQNPTEQLLHAFITPSSLKELNNLNSDLCYDL